jgi:ADP-heptose:LPS heptosyltransferase
MTKPCDCPAPGFCQRFQREMCGRWFELCRGINTDIGTAAAFRAQWDHEAAEKIAVLGLPKTPARPITLLTDQAVGDAVSMTAAIYSLHKAHPGKYLTSVSSLWPEVFAYNPDVSPPATETALLHMHYPAIHQSNQRGIHFMQGWTEFLGDALGIVVPLLTDRPRLYFPDRDPPVEDYWIVCSGGKRDLTNKLWGHHNYREVVSSLKGLVWFVQVGGSLDDHLRILDAEDMVGKTTLRQLFNLVRRARGVLCGVSLLMHVAAALEKPAVVIAGGREPVSWNSYPKQQYVHTVGSLPCRDVKGRVGGACWRSRVVPLGDNTVLDKNPCERPANGIPRCMEMISPASVAELVLRYNQ